MATEIKLRRGTTAEHASFTGVQGEVTVDTDLNTIRVHDGQTASGHRVLLYSEFVGAGTGTVTQVATGTGLTGGPITASGTVSLDTATQTTLTNSQTAYGWGNHATAGYLTAITGQVLSSLSNVSGASPNAGQVLGWDAINAYWKPIDQTGGGGSGGSSNFLGLTDVTPSAYTDQGGKFVKVNSAASGLEFGEATGENNLAGNVGQGIGIYYQKNSTTSMLEFKSLVAGTNITLLEGTNEITVSAANISYTGGTGIDVSNTNVISVDASVLTADASPTMTGTLTFTNNPVFTNNLTLDKTLKLTLPAATSKEIFSRSTISDAANDFFENSNSSTASGVFTPAIRSGVASTANSSALNIISEIPSARDSGSVNLVEFVVRRGSDVDDYSTHYGSVADITTRPLFEFKNNATSVLKMETTGTTIASGLTVNGDTNIPHNLKFKNSFSLLSGLQSGIDAATYPGCMAVANNDLYYSATSNSGEWIKVADFSLVPTGVFGTVAANSGSTTANTITDTLTVTGGNDIDTVISGDTLTINYTGSGGGGGGTTQSLWERINADSGFTTANSAQDVLTVAGGNGITTAITGDTLTIANDLYGTLHFFDRVLVSGQSTIQASGTQSLNFAAGTDIGITTDSSTRTITIAYTGSGGGGGGGTSLAFKTIAITGTSNQSDVVADSAEDTLTLNAGSGINLGTSGDTITISATASSPAFSDLSDTPGSLTANQLVAVNSGGTAIEFIQKDTIAGNAFTTFNCPSGENVSADTSTDTFIFQAGTGISISGNNTSDTVTISSTASSSFDRRLLSATTYVVSGASSSYYYIFMPDGTTRINEGTPSSNGQNPTLYVMTGTTVCFDLTTAGNNGNHPFYIKDTNTGTSGTSNAYDTGLIHYDGNTTYLTGSNAQGKTSGYLFWTIPTGISGNYGYQCQSHSGMLGTIVVKDLKVLA